MQVYANLIMLRPQVCSLVKDCASSCSSTISVNQSISRSCLKLKLKSKQIYILSFYKGRRSVSITFIWQSQLLLISWRPHYSTSPWITFLHQFIRCSEEVSSSLRQFSQWCSWRRLLKRLKYLGVSLPSLESWRLGYQLFCSLWRVQDKLV